MRPPRSRGSQFYLGQLVLVAVGLGTVAAGHWRDGIGLVGLTFLLGAAYRVVISTEQEGMLNVRHRWFDVVWTALLGASLLTLAIVVPTGPSA